MTNTTAQAARIAAERTADRAFLGIDANGQDAMQDAAEAAKAEQMQDDYCDSEPA